MYDLNQIIPWALTNFGLVMAMIAVPLIIIGMIVNAFTKKSTGYELIYCWMSLALGATSLYAFAMHVFWPETAAATIGWQTSPFQFEVGIADLAFGILAIFAFAASYGFRLANAIGNLFWLWGDAAGHVIQMYTNNNFAVGNAGSWFWMDILFPAVLIICISRMGCKPAVKKIEVVRTMDSL